MTKGEAKIALEGLEQTTLALIQQRKRIAEALRKRAELCQEMVRWELERDADLIEKGELP